MDYAELFEQIGSYLAERGYAWVVEQVREELAAGQLTQERISTLAEVRSELAECATKLDELIKAIRAG